MVLDRLSHPMPTESGKEAERTRIDTGVIAISKIGEIQGTIGL